MQTIVDLLEESDHWAQTAGAATVSAAHVQQALDAQVYRNDRVRQAMQEETLRGAIMLDTTGSQIGQINGLSVISMGTFAFGRPSRITAAVHLGKGDVVNIEREVELSAETHDACLENVAEAHEKCVDGGFGLVLGLARGRQEQGLTDGVLDGIVGGVLQNFGPSDDIQHRHQAQE